MNFVSAPGGRHSTLVITENEVRPSTLVSTKRPEPLESFNGPFSHMLLPQTSGTIRLTNWALSSLEFRGMDFASQPRLA